MKDLTPVAIVAGPLIEVSSVFGIAPDSTVPRSVEEQTRLALENLETALAPHGASIDDVVQVIQYLVDVRDLPLVDRVFSEVFAEKPPARTAIGITGLLKPELRLELHVTAHLSAKVSNA